MGRLMSMQFDGGRATPPMDELTLAFIFPDEYLHWRGFAPRPTAKDMAIIERAYATHKG